MSTEIEPNFPLEIGHVLFLDVVGYSKLLIDDQRELQQQLNRIVRGTEQFRAADAVGKLVRLPTGDGIALVFFTNPEAPVECALEISEALQGQPQLRLRMGINTGPVSGIADVNDRSNVAGAGINMAQRVMDAGDAGHILLSKRAAEDLAQYRRWEPQLHDLGEFEVKHGVRISLVNLYTDKLGNPQLPEKLKQISRKQASTRRLKRTLIAGLLLLAVTLAVLFLRRTPSKLPAGNATLIPEKSIAVLPFENLSRDPENAFFAGGVQNEILTNLARIADLKVISRTSVMNYKTDVARNLREIGQQLGVAHLLEGSVQRASNQVRVNAQLIDARTDAHVWAQTYDRYLADVFAIQSDIAKTIADQLQARLSPTEKAAIEQRPTADLAAFDLYTRAKTLRLAANFGPLYKDRILQAVELLNQAVARDPAFLLAWCELATAHDSLYFLGYDHTPARLTLADSAVQTALRFGPDAGEAHLTFAQHLYHGYRDYDRARVELEVARRTLPNSAEVVALTGYIDRRQGRWAESTRNFQRAIHLDPRNTITLSEISVNYSYLRRYAEAAAGLDRVLAILPKDVLTRVTRAWVDFEWRADPQPLHATIDAILVEDPGAGQILAGDWLFLALCERDLAAADRALAALSSDEALTIGQMFLSRAFAEGLVARVRGDTVAARAAFTTARVQQEEAIRAHPEYAPALCVLGLIDAGLGRKEDAAREGRRAVELLPVERDSLVGADLLVVFAIICAWTDEKDLAFQQLAIGTQIPGLLSYGQLRLNPFWDPLRSDPRFDKIVASLAPKE